jgi:hypothetical protein
MKASIKDVKSTFDSTFRALGDVCSRKSFLGFLCLAALHQREIDLGLDLILRVRLHSLSYEGHGRVSEVRKGSEGEQERVAG